MRDRAAQRKSVVIKYSAELIEKKILANPQSTTEIATRHFTAKEVDDQMSSENQVERLFGYLCSFARGENETAGTFATELFQFMRLRDGSANHSLLCEYFFNFSQFYLPKKLERLGAIETLFNDHKVGLERNRAFVADYEKSGLVHATFEWIKAIEATKMFAPHDVQTLIKILDVSEKEREFHSKLSLGIGHIIGHFENEIPVAVIARFKTLISKLLEQSHIVNATLQYVFHHKTNISTGSHIGYPHSRFEAKPDNYFSTIYIETPNTMITSLAEHISSQPACLIHCWTILENDFDFSNLDTFFKTNEDLKIVLESSDDGEVRTLLSAFTFWKMYPKVFDQGVMGQTLSECSNRLKPFVVFLYVSRYVSEYQYKTRPFDESLHQFMKAAMQPYLDRKAINDYVDAFDRVQPYSYARHATEIKEQVSETLARTSTTVSTTFMEYATPLANSIATYSTSLFARYMGSQRPPAPTTTPPDPRNLDDRNHTM